MKNTDHLAGETKSERKKRIHAENVARYRANLKAGVKMVGVPVTLQMIDGFITADQLLEHESEDTAQVADAILEIISQYFLENDIVKNFEKPVVHIQPKASKRGSVGRSKEPTGESES